MYSDRDTIQTRRESQTEDLAGKTKERAARSPSFVQLGLTLTQEGVEVYLVFCPVILPGTAFARFG